MCVCIVTAPFRAFVIRVWGGGGRIVIREERHHFNGNDWDPEASFLYTGCFHVLRPQLGGSVESLGRTGKGEGEREGEYDM